MYRNPATFIGLLFTKGTEVANLPGRQTGIISFVCLNTFRINSVFPAKLNKSICLLCIICGLVFFLPLNSFAETLNAKNPRLLRALRSIKEKIVAEYHQNKLTLEKQLEERLNSFGPSVYERQQRLRYIQENQEKQNALLEQYKQELQAVEDDIYEARYGKKRHRESKDSGDADAEVLPWDSQEIKNKRRFEEHQRIREKWNYDGALKEIPGSDLYKEPSKKNKN